MGNVSSKDIEYKIYTLGDIGVIELLISYRYKYDDYLFARESSIAVVNGVLPINDEMVLTYVSLDEYIKRCKFDILQMRMIKLIEHGYSYEEISSLTGVHLSAVKGRMKTIYKRIAKENEWQWKKSIYVDKLELRTKQCSKCKEDLPATVEFYSNLKKTKDGFHSQCRKCKV